MNLDQFDGHTPGPWHTRALDPNTQTEWAAVTSTGDWILRVAEDNKGWPLSQADARLIAAAPELLAEVKRLREWRSAILYKLPRPHLDEILHGLLEEADEVEAWAKEKRDWYARCKLPMLPSHNEDTLCLERIMGFSGAEVIRLIEEYWGE